MELHTFSSLNKNFLPQYHNTMEKADRPIVFFNPEVLANKQLPALSVSEVAEAFNIPESAIVTSSAHLLSALNSVERQSINLLVMTSGNLGGINIKEWVDKRAWLL
jgi:UDP-N-acetylmuramate: L-alanyl-gamma-D-glutamyl-meso-diaminopimelate ligase